MPQEAPSLPQITTLPSLDTSSRAGVLDLLFEPSTQLHTLSVTALSEHSFTSYANLIAHIESQFTALLKSDLESDQKWLDTILGAHPRLGEKKVESAMSRAEQAAMKAAESATSGQATGGRSSGDAEDVARRLADLNAQYEATFPGLRYV
jgi:2-oxo-4-hydroxy-4-carboxy--5-ureidoimidazoline (OHCU) decarboxylase